MCFVDHHYQRGETKKRNKVAPRRYLESFALAPVTARISGAKRGTPHPCRDRLLASTSTSASPSCGGADICSSTCFCITLLRLGSFESYDGREERMGHRFLGGGPELVVVSAATAAVSGGGMRGTIPQGERTAGICPKSQWPHR